MFCAILCTWWEAVLRRAATPFCAGRRAGRARSSASLSEDTLVVLLIKVLHYQSIFRFCTQAREFRHLHKVLHREFRHLHNLHKIAQP